MLVRIIAMAKSYIGVIVFCCLAACSSDDNNRGDDNESPVANAGQDITVNANITVNLDGSGSMDVDGSIVSYSWRRISGTSVDLIDANTVQASFVAPANNGELIFELTVVDNAGASATDSIRVTVENGIDLEIGLDARPDNSNCIAPITPGTTSDTLDLVDVFPNLDLTELQFPLGMRQMPGNDNYFFVITREGRVWRFDNDAAATTPTLILDIQDSVSTSGEGGLLGFAFHPQVMTNRAIYLSYTASSPFRSILSRFTLSPDFSSIDPDSERVVLTVNQPFGNHNGGDIHFGPDGYLYFGLGDGGSANDPQGNGQNTNTLLGSMLRIDVDPITDAAPFYSIPPDNPFVGGGGAPEIFAYGLRNPFRWSFDISDGQIWLGDVGQGLREEVDIIVNGGNYGWVDMEGNNCRIADCSGFVSPIHDYPRSVGSSITGGYVYRGADVPSLDGIYIFGDFGSGRIWTLTPNGSDYDRVEVATPSGSIVSFAQDNAGEVYVLLAFPGDGRSIKKIQDMNGSTGSNIPTLLSQTGCFDPADPTQPDSGLIPFNVVTPLWSDGAQKQRWMALPNGATIDVDSLGDFNFPVGTILAKHFGNGGTLIETRLLMLHQTGWNGYSYRWLPDQSDAELLAGAVDENVAGLDWHYPSRAECRQCHTPVKNFALAPEVIQINNDFLYPQTGRTANQVITLNSIGVFTSPPNSSLDSATLLALDDNGATMEQRAKSYLHTNCSQCHQPGGTGEGDIDLRFETPLVDMGICDVPPVDDLGIAGARYIAPGNPDASVILQRMLALPNSDPLLDIRMPPLATSLVDTEATDVVTDWINDLGIGGCP